MFKRVALAAACVAGAAVLAADSQAGTWKLNEAKSKFSDGAPKNRTVVYAVDGENIKVTVDGIDANGAAAHNEWIGKFDGHDYPVAGDATADTRSYIRYDDRTLSFTQKKDGKITMLGRIVLSADGKSRTVTTSGTDARGRKFNTTAVYDKR